MKMLAGMQLISCVAVGLCCGVLAAAPVVSNVTMAQVNGTVEIGYELSGEPGIVTVDIRTNNVSIGDANIHYLTGDVNRKIVPDGNVHKIHWAVHKSWRPLQTSENVTAVVRAWSLNAPPDYMVVDLNYEGVVSFYTSEEALPHPITNDVYKTDCLVMRKIPAAGVTWMMGSAQSGETARHRVSFSADYYMGVYELTHGQYLHLMGEGSIPSKSPNRSVTGYETYPVGFLGFEDIRDNDWPIHEGDAHYVSNGKVCHAMRTKAGGIKFDLPTEAQWEYACRAGNGTLWGNGQGTTEENARLMGWTTLDSDSTSHPVGLKQKNDWGLFDMHGNMLEWTLDYHSSADRSVGAGVPVEDPAGPTASYDQYLWRMLCGGSYSRAYSGATATSRVKSGSETIYTSNDSGMRFCCPAVVP